MVVNPQHYRRLTAKHEISRSIHAFDLLWLDGADLTFRPLQERKALLSKTVRKETPRLTVSRCVEERGRALYTLTERQGLEGIVAKRLDSFYHPGKRTKDWIKIEIRPRWDK